MTIVETSAGPVRGQRLPGGRTTVFRSIPYAMPPVAALRWRAPRAPQPWTTPRDCTEFGPVAIQARRSRHSVIPLAAEAQSESCLTLTVWAPAQVDEQLPVIVWLHPGGFQAGSASAAMYDGSAFARAGAVLVAPNYRLAKLGFLAHPELADTQPDDVGNYGLRDQVLALSWIQQNIQQFGGDPACVTLLGTSSGASSVSLLMTAPSARGLFHRAIAESGGSFGPIGATTGIGDRWQTYDGAVAAGASWARSVGLPTLAQLRNADVDLLRRVSVPASSTNVLDASRPIVDGALLTQATAECFRNAEQAPVPLLVGGAANEDLAMYNFPRDRSAYVAHARAEHGTGLADFLALYPARSDNDAVAAGLKSNGHRLFTWQNWTWARLHATAGHPVYYYRFEVAPPVPPNRYDEQRLPRPLGAFHCASLYYLFDRFDLQPDWAWQKEDRDVSTTMVQTWVDFARTGRPEPTHDTWPQFDPADPQVMSIGWQPVYRPVPDRMYLDFWDHFYGFSPAHSAND